MDEHTQAIGGLRDHRFDSMDQKMSRHFLWQTGILLSGLIAMMGTLGGIIAVLIRGT